MIELASVLRWEKTMAHGAARFYEVRVDKDLWGALTLTRVWGRRGSARDRVTHTPVPEHDIEQVISEIQHRRLQHRYVLVSDIRPLIIRSIKKGSC